MKTVKLNAKTGQRAGWWHYVGPLQAGEPFVTSGALRGGPLFNARTDTGRLPASYVESFRLADYAVWSYGTPIAWHTPAMYPDRPAAWHVPAERYSVTTTQHQNKIHTAVTKVAETWGQKVYR